MKTLYLRAQNLNHPWIAWDMFPIDLRAIVGFNPIVAVANDTLRTHKVPILLTQPGAKRMLPTFAAKWGNP